MKEKKEYLAVLDSLRNLLPKKYWDGMAQSGKISVSFSSFNTESQYDGLFIYDGVSTSSKQIGVYSGTSNPGTITATNKSGALTFRFVSDKSSNKTGWVATIKSGPYSKASPTTKIVMSKSDITVSEGIFLDPGGERNYPNGLDFSQTIRPRKIKSEEPLNLVNIYSQINLNNYSQKTELLRQYITNISFVTKKEDRRIVFDAILNLSITNLSQTKENITLLSNSVKNISSANFDYLPSFVQVILKNEDGFELIKYFNSIIPQFNKNIHMSVLDLYGEIYYETKDLDLVKMMMDGYTQFIPKFEANDQLVSLEAHLNIFIKKLQLRKQEIDKIENDYEREVASINSEYERKLAEARSEAIEKKAKKVVVRFPSLYIFLSSLGVIAFLALLLVLLSLQRTLSAIKIKLDE